MRRLVMMLGTALLATPLGGACSSTVDGVIPVGGEEPSTVELERFTRRLHLDLTGRPPDENAAAAALAQLESDNSAANRAALADELLESDAFAEQFVSELENRAFGGESPDSRYDLLCFIVRDEDPECRSCPTPQTDPCAECSCSALEDLAEERAGIAATAADLAANRASSAEIERRYATAAAFSFLIGDPGAIAGQMFEVFLGRPAEPEERANAQAMIIGALLPDSPAGLLFHRHGANLDDLVDIIFESEIYREAAIGGVFQRYLGRLPTPMELAHFTGVMTPDTPDIRPVIRAVVSSREYFAQ